MIVSMRKVHVIFPSHTVPEDVKRLQEFGLMDIQAAVVEQANDDLSNKYTDVISALDRLSSTEDASTNASSARPTSLFPDNRSVYDIVKEINLYVQKKDTLIKQKEDLQLVLREMQKLGEVSSHMIKIFSHHGVEVCVYTSSASDKHVPIEDKHSSGVLLVQTVYRSRDEKIWVVISFLGASYTVPESWSEYMVSDQTPKEIISSLEKIEQDISGYDNKIDALSSYADIIHIHKMDLENELAIRAVQTGATDYNGVVVVSGFIPVDNIQEFRICAADHCWGLVVDKVDPEEQDVPTKLKNIRPVKMMKPLLKLMDTVPGYKEYDISGMFLLSLTLFFGMIIGDAGYGTVLLLSTALIAVFAKKKTPLFSLALYFMAWNALATIAWGAITGNWFGYAPFAGLPYISSLIIPQFSVLNSESTPYIWYFAFTVGLVHISIAHLWGAIRAIKLREYYAALNHVGSGVMVYGLYFLVLVLLLGTKKYPLPSYALPCVFSGFGLVLITAEQIPGRNFFVGVLVGLAKSFLHALGSLSNFADIISYIRLFAVGFASLAIANAFNVMAAGLMSGGGVVGIASGILVLLFAHTFNLSMGLLAIIIHGVRLNVLEFGMHLGMEWTGREYAPFRKKEIITLEE